MRNRVNVGCGQTAIEGWVNFDNSLTVRLAQFPLLSQVLAGLGFFTKEQTHFLEIIVDKGIKWANAASNLPLQNNSANVVYTSHMLEHLTRSDARLFLAEAKRVLTSGGIIRIAVPDVRYHVDRYLRNGDADQFIDEMLLTSSRPKGFISKLKFLITGDRHHQWMYDGNSLRKLLTHAGFNEPVEMEGGETLIPNPGPLNLKERLPESVFVEAVNP